MTSKRAEWRVGGVRTTLAVVLVVGILAVPLVSGAAVTLRFLQTEPSPETVDALKKVIGAFEAKHPGIKVEMETVGWAAQMERLIAGIASGQAPDVSMLELAPATSFAHFEHLLSLDDVASEIGRGDFTGNLLALTSMNGQQMTIPYMVHVPVLYYRKDLFVQANLAPPTTWDEYLQAAKTLTRDGVYGGVVPFGRNTATRSFFYYLAASNEGFICDKDLRVVFNSPANVEALKFMKELARYSPPGSAEYSWSEIRNAYTLGKAAMAHYPGRLLSEAFKQNPRVGENTGLALMPKKRISRAQIGMTSLGVFKASRYPQEAKSFVKFLLQGSNQAAVVLAVPTAYHPTRKSVAASPEYLAEPFIQKHQDLFKVLLAALDKGGHFVAEHPGTVNPYFGRIDAENVLPDMVQKTLLQGMPAEEAVGWAHKRMAEIVEQAKKEEKPK